MKDAPALILRIESQRKALRVRDQITIGRPGMGHDIEIEGDGVAGEHALITRAASGFTVRALSPKHLVINRTDGKYENTPEIDLDDGVHFQIGETLLSCHLADRLVTEPKKVGNANALKAIFKDFDQGLQPFFKEKVHRIGIIGGQGSGKTCFLTALGMSRRPHPDGLTCTQLRKLDPEAEGLKKISAERKARLIQEFRDGYQRVKISIQLLLSGGVPEKSPLEVLRMIYFLGGCNGQPETNIELVDYAGEMIEEEDPIEDIPNSKKLFNILNEVDGFMILVETPQPNANREIAFDLPYTQLLHRIKQVFLELNLKKIDRPRPVAILLNKWDRCRELSKASFVNECSELERWAETTAGQTLQELRNVVLRGFSWKRAFLACGVM
ncbi:MAG: hypothetical protein JJU00_04180, partial [Opitutales bacterium]|nr:hypothetical protein [Opitutales bacterium]